MLMMLVNGLSDRLWLCNLSDLGEYDFFLSYERYVFFQWSHDTRVMNINIPSYSDIAFYL